MSYSANTAESLSTATRASRRLSKRKKILIAVIVVSVFVAIALMLVIVYALGGFDRFIYNYNADTYSIKKIAKEDLSIHFMKLDNGANGDSIYIKAGDTDILVDAGSKQTSAKSIGDSVDRYCKDGILEYVIVTHADKDHISGFVGTEVAQGIFDRYECQNIIQFARTDKNTQIYQKYCSKRDAEIAAGANCYTALECYNNTNGAKREYELARGITLKILYQEYYEKSSAKENNYSVCFMITQEYVINGRTKQNNYLFTGDLEKSGEESLVNCNPDLPEVVLYKGAHHGSRTSTNEVLLEKVKPQIVCVSCVAGSIENTQTLPNTFPTQAFVNRIAPYTDAVYVTDVATVQLNSSGTYENINYSAMNGDIVFACTDGRISMYFSNNDTKLKDTTWFKENRTCPQAWL